MKRINTLTIMIVLLSITAAFAQMKGSEKTPDQGTMMSGGETGSPMMGESSPGMMAVEPSQMMQMMEMMQSMMMQQKQMMQGMTAQQKEVNMNKLDGMMHQMEEMMTQMSGSAKSNSGN